MKSDGGDKSSEKNWAGYHNQVRGGASEPTVNACVHENTRVDQQDGDSNTTSKRSLRVVVTYNSRGGASCRSSRGPFLLSPTNSSGYFSFHKECQAGWRKRVWYNVDFVGTRVDKLLSVDIFGTRIEQLGRRIEQLGTIRIPRWVTHLRIRRWFLLPPLYFFGGG